MELGVADGDAIPVLARLGLAAVIAFGLAVRVTNLDRMPVWYDEALSLVRASGLSLVEVGGALAAKSEHRAVDLLAYQTPGGQVSATPRPLWAPAAVLARENPEHPPLYFVVLALWSRVFGGSVTSARALSAVFGILLLSATYWLVCELFGSRRTAWTAAALVAVSPIHVLYSREIGPYSLSILLVASSSAVLLAALRSGRISWWALYAATICAGLATQILFILTVTAHAVYVVWGWSSSGEPKSSESRYWIATAFGLLLFAPWVGFILRDPDGAIGLSWVRTPVAPIFWIGALVRNVASPFFDVMPASPKPTTEAVVSFLASGRSLLVAALTCAAAGFAVISAVRLHRKAPPRTSRFVLLPIAVTALVLLLPDLVFGGRRATVFRYFLPALLSLELAVSYVLASPPEGTTRPRSWRAPAAVAIFLAAVVSCATIARADTWWTKAQNRFDRRAVASIEGSADPVLVFGSSRAATVNALCFAHLLDRDTRVRIIRPDEIPRLDPADEAVFLFADPTDIASGRAMLEREYRLAPVADDERLWRVLGRRSRPGS